jgi:hypothetical protein
MKIYVSGWCGWILAGHESEERVDALRHDGGCGIGARLCRAEVLARFAGIATGDTLH